MASIYRRGAYQFEAVIRKRGYPTQRKSFPTKAEAKDWVSVIESEMVRGVFVSRSLAEKTLFGSVLDRFEAEVVPGLAGADQEKYRVRVIKRRLGAYSLAALTSAIFATYRDERLQEVGPGTVRHELILAGRVLKCCQMDWGIPLPAGIPTEQIRKPSMPKGRDRRLLKGEEDLLLAELEAIDRNPDGTLAAQTRNPWVKPLFQLALETAMRRGELMGLKWRYIDLERAVAHLPMTKNGDARDVPLSPVAVGLLKNMKAERDKVAQNNDEDPEEKVFPTSEESVKTVWQRSVKRARRKWEEQSRAGGKREKEIELDRTLMDLHFHDLRHEATSRMASRFQAHELAKITGHKTIGMLLRYYHPRAEELAKKL